MRRSSGAQFQQKARSSAYRESQETMGTVTPSENCFEFFEEFLVDKAVEVSMRQRRLAVIQRLQQVVAGIVAARVQEFKAQKQLRFSWFDVVGTNLGEQPDLYSEGSETDFLEHHLLPRFRLVDFGSTRLGVESAQSDLDLLVTTFDCLFERLPFFHKFEAKMKQEKGISNFILLKNAHVPLAKFTMNGIKVDIAFADMATPYSILREVHETEASFRLVDIPTDYLLRETSVHSGNVKSSDCLAGFLQSQRLAEILEQICPSHQNLIKRIFSETTVLVKCWATKRGIYNFNLGYLNGISIMVLVVRALVDFYRPDNVHFWSKYLNGDYSSLRQAIIEHFFDMYAEWSWCGQSFDERVIFLTHPDDYLRSSPDCDSCTREAIEHSLGQSMMSNMVILSPSVPFRGTVPQMTTSCRNKIIKEFKIAKRNIYLAKARYPELNFQKMPTRKNKVVSEVDQLTHSQLLSAKWSDLFFPSTVLNETNFFLTLEYSTRQPTQGETISDVKLKHSKVLGFIESRIKTFLQALQLQFGMLGPEDGILTHSDLVIVPESPFQTGELSSCFVIALPVKEVSDEIVDIVTQAQISFDLRLGGFIEIGGWVQHSSAYRIVDFEGLPSSVHKTYFENFESYQKLVQTSAEHRSKVDSLKENPERNEQAMLAAPSSLFDQLQASLT